MALPSLLSKGVVKLFHGAKKDFKSFDSKYAAETAFGKGFSFTPDKKVAESYAKITPHQLKKLYGKQYLEAAIERKKEGEPLLYQVEAELKDSETLMVRKNLSDQDEQVQEKIKTLIEKENIDINDLDVDKPKFWRQILKITEKDADELFSKYGIKGSIKDARGSSIKQVGGDIEYTIYDPSILKIVDKMFLDRDKKNKGGEMKKNEKQEAPDYHHSEIFERAMNKGARNVLKDLPLTDGPPEAVADLFIFAVEKYRELKNKLDKTENKQERQKKAVGSVAQKASEGADSLLAAARQEVSDINREEEQLEIPVIPQTGTESVQEGAEELKVPTPILASIWFSENENPPLEEELDPFEDAVIEALVEDESTFEFNDKVYDINEASELEEDTEETERLGKLFGGMVEKLMRKSASKGNKKALTFLEKTREKAKLFDKTFRKAFDFKTLKQPQALKTMIPTENVASSFPSSTRKKKADGGEMAVPPELEDTYPNIPPEEMEEAKASQLPDTQMEEEYAEFILDESLNENDQTYLMNALEQDEKLSIIFDRVMDVATEFSGAGPVKGNGTGVSDSIPARLSDGEFVFTKKAVDQIGAENLQKIMDEAERSNDEANGKLQMQYGGMVIDDEDPTSYEKSFLGSSEVSEDLKKEMLKSNQMPRQR